MKLFLAAFAILVSFVHSAPSSQYILYNPAILPGRTIYKLPGTIVQSTTPLKLANDGKQNFFYILPTSTLTYPYQIIMLRDEPSGGNNFDFWQVIQNWFGQAGGQGESGAAGEAGAAPEQSAEMKKMLQKFEMFDKDGNKMPEAMKKDEIKKLYILSQQPQFINSIQYLSPSYSPIYTYTPLIGRSSKLEQEQPLLPVEQPLLAVVPAQAQVVPEPLPLVKAVEPVVDPVLILDPLIAANPLSVSPVQEKILPGPEVPLQARSSLEAEKEMIEEMIAEKEMEKKPEEELIKKEELKEEIIIEQKKLEGR